MLNENLCRRFFRKVELFLIMLILSLCRFSALLYRGIELIAATYPDDNRAKTSVQLRNHKSAIKVDKGYRRKIRRH